MHYQVQLVDDAAYVSAPQEADPRQLKVLRYLVEQQSGIFLGGLERHLPLTAQQVERATDVTDVNELVRGATIVFEDELFAAARLLGPVHGTGDGLVSAERAKALLMRLVWHSPYVNDDELRTMLEREGIALTRSQVGAYRQWLGLGRPDGGGFDAALERFAPCLWLSHPLKRAIDRDRERVLVEREARARAHVRRQAEPDALLSLGPGHSLPTGYQPAVHSLFEHQTRAVTSLRRWYASGEPSGVICLPTGAGKTKTAISFVVRELVPGARCLWLAHRDELLAQAYDAFVENGHRASSAFRLGRWTATHKDEAPADVLVASIPTLTRADNLESFEDSQGEFDFIVVDECHHGAARTWMRLLEALRVKSPKLRLLGLSATPTRTNQEELPLLWQNFGAVIHSEPATPLIELQILAKPRLVVARAGRIVVEASEQERRGYTERGDLPQSLVTRIAEDEQRNLAIVQAYLRPRDFTNLDTWGQTLIFAATVKQAQALSELLRRKGVRVAEIYGTTARDRRATVVQRFRDRTVQVVVNCGVFTEGTDLPSVETVFLGRPTTSPILFAQMVGRGMRGPKTGGSEYCNIVSFYEEVVGLLQGALHSSMTDESQAFDALGIERDAGFPADPGKKPAKPRAVEPAPPMGKDWGELLESLEITGTTLSLLGWWVAPGGARAPYLACLSEEERRAVEEWIETCAVGELKLAQIDVQVVQAFERACQTGRPVWVAAQSLTAQEAGAIARELAGAPEPNRARERGGEEPKSPVLRGVMVARRPPSAVRSASKEELAALPVWGNDVSKVLSWVNLVQGNISRGRARAMDLSALSARVAPDVAHRFVEVRSKPGATHTWVPFDDIHREEVLELLRRCGIEMVPPAPTA